MTVQENIRKLDGPDLLSIVRRFILLLLAGDGIKEGREAQGFPSPDIEARTTTMMTVKVEEGALKIRGVCGNPLPAPTPVKSVRTETTPAQAAGRVVQTGAGQKNPMTMMIDGECT